MDREQLWQRIRYRRGRLLFQGRETDVALPVIVVRRERDSLLVRCDTQLQAAIGTPVSLEIWGPDVLTRTQGRLERLLPRADGSCMLMVRITDTDALQRRASRRYETRLLTSFIPKHAVQQDETPEPFVRYAVGHATNIGLGGMQLETEYDMPVGVTLQLKISAPGGPLVATGRIVDKRNDGVGLYVYGIELTDFDNLTAARLHRIVNRMEREQVRRRRPSRYAEPRAIGRRARYRRFYSRRTH